MMIAEFPPCRRKEEPQDADSDDAQTGTPADVAEMLEELDDAPPDLIRDVHWCHANKPADLNEAAADLVTRWSSNTNGGCHPRHARILRRASASCWSAIAPDASLMVTAPDSAVLLTTSSACVMLRAVLDGAIESTASRSTRHGAADCTKIGKPVTNDPSASMTLQCHRTRSTGKTAEVFRHNSVVSPGARWACPNVGIPTASVGRDAVSDTPTEPHELCCKEARARHEIDAPHNRCKVQKDRMRGEFRQVCPSYGE